MILMYSFILVETYSSWSLYPSFYNRTNLLMLLPERNSYRPKRTTLKFFMLILYSLEYVMKPASYLTGLCHTKLLPPRATHPQTHSCMLGSRLQRQLSAEPQVPACTQGSQAPTLNDSSCEGLIHASLHCNNTGSSYAKGASPWSAALVPEKPQSHDNEYFPDNIRPVKAPSNDDLPDVE